MMIPRYCSRAAAYRQTCAIAHTPPWMRRGARGQQVVGYLQRFEQRGAMCFFALVACKLQGPTVAWLVAAPPSPLHALVWAMSGPVQVDPFSGQAWSNHARTGQTSVKPHHTLVTRVKPGKPRMRLVNPRSSIFKPRSNLRQTWTNIGQT